MRRAVKKQGICPGHHVRQQTPDSDLEGEAVLQPSVHATGQVGWWNGKTEKAGKWRKATCGNFNRPLHKVTEFLLHQEGR